MLPRTLKPLCQGTSAAAPGTRNSDKPKNYCPPIDGGELIDTSGLVGFRTTLLCEGISENTSHIITNSRRKGTLTNYESAWRKWASWWLERKIDDFAFQLWQRIWNNKFAKVSNFCFHEYIDRLPVGKHSRICSLVSGVFNLRPPKPRYMFVWDVKQVLDFLKEMFGDNDQLSNKELTLKVTILLALTKSSRTSALHILDLNHMIKTSGYYEFRSRKLHKSWRRDESPPSLKIYAFPSDKALCVVAALDYYIERSSIWREKKSNFSIIS